MKTKTGPQTIPAFPCKEFGCYFRVDGGDLECAPMLLGGAIDRNDEGGENWGEVEDLSYEVASYLNLRFGTSFEANV